MFEWLAEELEEIKTKKFHLVDGPVEATLREAMEQVAIPFPGSYKEFVVRFGNARLYRSGSSYLVEVYAAPREAICDDGERVFQIGKADANMSYFKESLLRTGCDSPVFDWIREAGLRKVADGFEEWLHNKCAAARNQFTKRQWEAIKRGPPPFSEHEMQVVAARKRFRWRVIGIAKNGDLRFEIRNDSHMTLPFLTVGVRGKHGEIEGGVWLPVESIGPGEVKVVEKPCYKEWLKPEDAVLYDEPDPGPEDRDRYWEFK